MEVLKSIRPVAFIKLRRVVLTVFIRLSRNVRILLHLISVSLAESFNLVSNVEIMM